MIFIKRIVFFICLFLLIFSTAVFAGVEELTDEDYLREDFGLDNYKHFATDSIDLKGCAWPEGTTVINYESPYNPRKNVSLDVHYVEIPESVVIISDWAFERRRIKEECIDFTKLTNLKYIGQRAFDTNYFSRIDLSKTQVVRIGQYAFTGCYTKTVVLPKTIKRVDDYAFLDARMGTMEFPEGLTYIGMGAFIHANIAIIPKSVTYMGRDAVGEKTLCKVYKGSYAEEWCKANNRNYMYLDDEVEVSGEQLGKTLKIGPVTFTGYVGYHYYDGQMDYYDKTVDVMQVGLYKGGKMIADVDGVDFMYTPLAWCTDFEECIGRTDGGTFYVYPPEPGYKVIKNLEDRGIIPHPSQKLSENTWTKGLAWEFHGPVAPNIIVSVNGREYLFQIHIKDPKQTEFVTSKLVDAVPTSSKVLVDEKEVNLEAYNINGNNYFKLRDVAMVLSGSKKQFNVIWNGESKCVDMLSNTAYAPVGGELSVGDGRMKSAETRNPSQLLKDGIPLFLKSCNINGSNYFKLRDLGKELDFNVSWDGKNNCILIETDKAYTEN